MVPFAFFVVLNEQFNFKSGQFMEYTRITTYINKKIEVGI